MESKISVPSEWTLLVNLFSSDGTGDQIGTTVSQGCSQALRPLTEGLLIGLAL